MNGKKSLLFLFLLAVCLYSSFVFAGNKADSLRKIIRTTQNDTVKAKAFNTLFKELLFSGNMDSAMYYAICDKDFTEKLLANTSLPKDVKECLQKQRVLAYGDIGRVYVNQGKFTEALKYDTVELNSAKQINYLNGLANAYGNLGSLYTCEGSYPEALQNELESLKTDEAIGDKRGMASAYTNIGNIYRAEKNFPEALKNHELCLKVSKEIGFKQGQTWAYNNIGDIEEEQGKGDEALVNYMMCIQVGKEIGYKEVIGASYANIGTIHSEEGKYAQAINDELQADTIFQELGSSQDLATTNVCLGEIYLKAKQYDQALNYFNRSLDSSLKSGYMEIVKQNYLDLSNLYESFAKQGKSPTENWEKAEENYKKYFLFHDSLFNEASRKKTLQTQVQFDFDKKEAVAKAEQEQKDAVNREERQRQKTILDCVLAGLLLVLALAFVSYRGYRLKQRANITISKQKDVVEQKNQIIEAKNKSITDSINYARLIQSAMLVPDEELNKSLGEYFILYQPKDIVSGDFYFYKNIPAGANQKETIYLAACDCTGHGVPGAFMSLIGNEKLSDAMGQANDTGQILKLLNAKIKQALHQSAQADSTRDGMDIALCSISPSETEKAAIVQYSGANRPLWISKKNKKGLEEIKPTKKSIGGFTDEKAEFNTHIMQLEKGDTLYMFTDGYADQFGGKEGKKLTTKRFLEFLNGITNISMAEQKAALQKFMTEWMGSNEQIDDILVIGIRI